MKDIIDNIISKSQEINVEIIESILLECNFHKFGYEKALVH